MPHAKRMGFVTGLTTAAALALPFGAAAQARSYQLVEGWPQLPSGVDRFGMTLGLELDAREHLWVFQRCFSTDCVDGPEETMPAVLEYDANGRLQSSWGEGMFVW